MDPLAAHVIDELGINEITKANPMEAAFTSGAAFTVGGLIPLMVTVFFPLKGIEYSLYGFTLFFLIILGAWAAEAGGSSWTKAILRISFWGTVAMGLTAAVGYLFGVNIN